MEKYKNYLKTEPEVVAAPKKLDVNDLEKLVLSLKEKLINVRTLCESNSPMSHIHAQGTEGLAEIDKILG